MSVKATEELMTLVEVVAVAVLRQIKKDGKPSWKDVGAVLASPDFVAAVQPALADFTSIPGELTGLGVLDGIALARYAVGCAAAVVAASKAHVAQ